MYEFEVGLFLNQQRSYFPCFLKTHNLFQRNAKAINTKQPLSDQISKTILKNKQLKLSKIDNIKSILETTENIVYDPVTCATKNNYMIVMEFFEGQTLKSLDDSKELDGTKTLNKEEYYHILFQIYGPLYALEGVYTHKDLHAGNVMVQELDNPVTFEYKYKLDFDNEDDEDDNEPKDNDGMYTVRFVSKYLVKLIDYGRGYFPGIDKRLDDYMDLVEKHEKTPSITTMRELQQYHNNLNDCGLYHLITPSDDLGMANLGARRLDYVVDTLRMLILQMQPNGRTNEGEPLAKKTKPKPTVKIDLSRVDGTPTEERKEIVFENFDDKLKSLFTNQRVEKKLFS